MAIDQLEKISTTPEADPPARGSALARDRGIATSSAFAPDTLGSGLSLTAGAALAVWFFGLWLLRHPYGGLIQDSVLYAVGALARLHPASLAHDIYLSRGSQDHYTLFSPIVAEVIRAIGIARAAALVTAVGQVALYGCGWILARRIMPARLAILAVTLLMLLPSLFGAKHIFWYTEDLMTPRVPAAALVLASLACAIGGRRSVAIVCVGAAMLLHPLMGLAGIVMLYMLFFGLQRPGLTACLGAAGLGALALVAYWLPFGRFARFDPLWFGLLHERLQYVFPSLWSLRDWGRMSVPLATLVVGSQMHETSLARSFCRAALATAGAGLAIALIGSDLLHIIVIAQIQTWRWLWLSNATAVLALPVVAVSCWRAGAGRRASLLLLVAAWISYEQAFVLIPALLAATLSALPARAADERRDKWVLVGALTIVALAIAFFIGLILVGLTHEPARVRGLPFFQSAFWLVQYRLRPWAMEGILPAAIFIAVWRIVVLRADRAASALLAASAVLCIALAPFAWFSWSNPAPSEQDRAKFAAWRLAIPPTAQVLAPGVPIVPWFLLDRASYWTLRQMAGVVFSRPLAVEFLRRENLIYHFPPAPTASRVLEGMCRSDPEIAFVVTPVDMGRSPYAPVALGSGKTADWLHLYRCADYLPQPGAASGRTSQASKG